jgi:hypothetical protein
VHFNTKLGQSVSAFQAQQAAADHGGAALAGRVGGDPCTVIKCAETEDAGL